MDHIAPSPTSLAQIRKRYAKASKKQRTQILNEFVANTKYHRHHASALLAGKRKWRAPDQPLHRARGTFYTAEDQQALLDLVTLFDDIGSKRLRVALNNEVANLRRNGHLKVSRSCYPHVCQVSPATMDRWRRAAPVANCAAARNRGRCSNIRFRFAPMRNGMTNARALAKLTWCRTMAAILRAISLAL